MLYTVNLPLLYWYFIINLYIYLPTYTMFVLSIASDVMKESKQEQDGITPEHIE